MPLFEETELFGANKKSQWVVLFRELGFEQEDMLWLEKELGYTTDTIPKGYLDKASAMMTQSVGELLPWLTWLLDAYTPFPYSKEKSTKVIFRALEQAVKHYPNSHIPLRYTTIANPSASEFPELAASNYIQQENQGKIDIVGAIGFLRGYEAMHSYYINILRANNDYIELELVFGYDAEVAKPLVAILEDTSLTITYNKLDRILTINGYGIAFRSGLQADLCSTLLTGKNVNKEWATDEIFESWGLRDNDIYDYSDDKPRLKKRLTIYQTGQKINEAVAKATDNEITELIRVTTKSATINPEYRKFVRKC